MNFYFYFSAFSASNFFRADRRRFCGAPVLHELLASAFSGRDCSTPFMFSH